MRLSGRRKAGESEHLPRPLDGMVIEIGPRGCAATRVHNPWYNPQGTRRAHWPGPHHTKRLRRPLYRAGRSGTTRFFPRTRFRFSIVERRRQSPDAAPRPATLVASVTYARLRPVWPDQRLQRMQLDSRILD